MIREVNCGVPGSSLEARKELLVAWASEPDMASDIMEPRLKGKG